MAKLKNKKERELFIENYRKWGIWKEIPELGLKYYRYDFPNGTYMMIVEYRVSASRYVAEHNGAKYHLVVSKDDNYTNGYGQCYNYFEPSGCSVGTLIDYLTKNRDLEIEV